MGPFPCAWSKRHLAKIIIPVDEGRQLFRHPDVRPASAAPSTFLALDVSPSIGYALAKA